MNGECPVFIQEERNLIEVCVHCFFYISQNILKGELNVSD